MKFLASIIAPCLFLVGIVRAESTPAQVSVCGLAAHSKEYLNKRVAVRGTVDGAFSEAFLSSPECPHVVVVLSFPEQTVRRASVERLAEVFWTVGGMGGEGKEIHGLFWGEYQVGPGLPRFGRLNLETIPEIDVSFIGGSQDIVHGRPP